MFRWVEVDILLKTNGPSISSNIQVLMGDLA